MNQRDTLCVCGHWYEEHENGGACTAPDCGCSGFEFSPELNTPEVIAESSGEHAPDCQCARCVAEREQAEEEVRCPQCGRVLPSEAATVEVSRRHLDCPFCLAVEIQAQGEAATERQWERDYLALS